MITTFLLRDLTLASLPDSYTNVILPSLPSTTSWDNLKVKAMQLAHNLMVLNGREDTFNFHFVFIQDDVDDELFTSAVTIAHGKGSLHINLAGSNRLITSVMFVPDLGVNLIS
ncbi:hypothetical protein JCM21900_004062 [Sporobolomyces salmonicolor]